jgi:hypothetical protein
MGRRTWLKLWTESWLRGTLREETAAVRGIFADVLALAGDSAYGDYGIIKLAKSAGLTDMQIAEILNIEPKEWLHAKKRLEETNRISIDRNNCISIINWKKYQSEYQRQKQYRQNIPKYRPKEERVTHGSYTEKEIEKETEEDKSWADFDD